ncbi:NAD(P)-dependent dehydrogenase (short-subunit alcohol dehydrogenase family) [Oxalobacteraceae bacterium GrIS 2.11]
MNQTAVLTLLSCRHEISAMLVKGYAAIVNLCSMAGQVGVVGATVYVAAMFVVEGLIRCSVLLYRAVSAMQNSSTFLTTFLTTKRKSS